MTAGQAQGTGAGWYQDPGSPGQLRWWTGTEWGENTTPVPPQQIRAVPLQMNHGLHLIVSIVTCGAWLPIWFIVWLSRRGQTRVEIG